MRAQPTGAIQQPETFAAGATPVRVLVVDDNAAHRRFGRCLFESLGCEVWVAEDGLEAVRLANTAPLDLILMDRHMPRCDGDAAAQQIRDSAGPSRHALIVSHSSNPPRGRDAAAYDAVIGKPARVVEVAHLVTLRRRRVSRLRAA